MIRIPLEGASMDLPGDVTPPTVFTVLRSWLQFTFRAVLGGLPGLLLLAFFVLLGLLGWEAR